MRGKSSVYLDSVRQDIVNYEQVAAEEITIRIAAMVVSADTQVQQDGLYLLGGLAWNPPSKFWQSWAGDQIKRYAADIIDESARSTMLRSVALKYDLITVDQALAMPGGREVLAQNGDTRFFSWSTSSYVSVLCRRLQSDSVQIHAFAGIGRHICAHQRQLLVHTKSPVMGVAKWNHAPDNLDLDELSGLGVAACIAICTEIGQYPRISLTRLPMPAKFRKLFQDWTAKQVHFVKFTERKRKNRK